MTAHGGAGHSAIAGALADEVTSLTEQRDSARRWAGHLMEENTYLRGQIEAALADRDQWVMRTTLRNALKPIPDQVQR